MFLSRAIGCGLLAATLFGGAAFADPPIRDVVTPAAPTKATPAPAVTGSLPPVVGKNITHVVKPGEDLYALGLHYKLAIEHFQWANNTTALSIPPGRKIIVPNQHILPAMLKDGLVINLPERGVYLFKNGEAVAFYPCAIGMGGRFATPVGDCKIISRQMYPTWSPPDWAGIKEPVPPGPNNPLGDRWIGLSMDGVGLHGTLDPMSIGQNASHGCMRMYPHVIRELFDRVKVGWPVKVMYDTVKVGISPEDRKIYVQVYPDVYGRVPDPLAVLKEKLARSGLLDLVDEARLKTLLANKSALPQLVLGDDIRIKVNGEPVTTSLAPFMKEGQIWASSDFLKALGAEMSFSAAEKSLVITRDGQEVHFQVGADGGEYTPRLWNGKSVLPVKPVLTALNLDFKYLPEHKTLLIYCADVNASI
ncbi:MAG: hypothetical protein FJX76_19040 [Armatimonadetes bacterium]|nr:hypothetical protein [Armatimonadota bacterium]